MRAHLLVLVAIFSLSLFAYPARAQMRGGTYTVTDDGHTAREEAEGKVVAEKLASGAVICTTLSADDFERLGEYYMGLMAGNAHVAMNAMIARQVGESGEEQMHVLMGERLSGCHPTAGNDGAVWGSSWFSMMGMMNSISGSAWSAGMMNRAGGTLGWNLVSLITTLLFWTVGVLAIIVLIRSLFSSQSKTKTK
ncbi:hypothetical protein HYV73_02375 [Candidatus Uhrbacteria bacterium]|nr:hypothetical protein [Candidatus Uhrbacteria bacterium]